MKVLYNQLKYALQKGQMDNNADAKGPLTLLDDSFLSADSFLQHLCKVFSSFCLFYIVSSILNSGGNFGTFTYEGVKLSCFLQKKVFAGPTNLTSFNPSPF